MIGSKEIQKNIDGLDILGVVTRAYSKIASNQMIERRAEVLQSRIYIDGMSAVFDEIRSAYEEEVKKISQKALKGFTFLSHNGKTTSVFLSANTGLYGEILNDVFLKFCEEVRKNNTEVTIVGRQGLYMFTNTFPKRQYTYFEMPDVRVDRLYVLNLVKHIVKYTEVHIYYGLFESIVSQKAKMISINSEIVGKQGAKSKYKYIIEPDLKSVLSFFEAEMFMSLINQTISESILAKLASRVVSMDAASERVRQEKRKMRIAKRRLIHAETDKKQLNSLTGVSMFY